MLLHLNDVWKRYGHKEVLRGADFGVEPGRKIGLVGPNGAGKTTLLGVILGEIEPDRGDVSRPRGFRARTIRQIRKFAPGATVFDAMMEEHADLLEMERKLRALEHDLSTDRQIAEYEKLSHEFEARGGYDLERRIETVLSGLGLAAMSAQPAESLSGGEGTRLALARVLVGDFDLLVLDEPSNHLDLESTLWLEDYLARLEKPVVLVSHDRRILDKVPDEIVELCHGRAYCYPGAYSAFIAQREERIERERKVYSQNLTRIEREEEFIRRNLAGQKTKQAKSRRKLLGRIKLEKPEFFDTINVVIANGARAGNVVLKLERLRVTRGQKTLLDNVDLEIRRGEKVALVGRNGTGKSSLIETIVGVTPPASGNVRLGANVSLGYFDQQHKEIFDDRTVLENMEACSDKLPGKLRDMLAAFGFTGEDVNNRAGTLSGGEKSRLSLAKIIARGTNFLILDEPTNHLDIDSVLRVEEALSAFTGTLLFVSHDREFLANLADRIIEIEDGALRDYQGGYDYYVEKKKNRPVGEKTAAPPSEGKIRYEEERRRKAENRKIKSRLAEFEKMIDVLEAEIEKTHRDMAEYAALPEKTAELAKTLAELEKKLERTYAELDKLMARM